MKNSNLQSLNLTPLVLSWNTALKICLFTLECGNSEGKQMAKEHLQHMANVADEYVAVKEQEQTAADWHAFYEQH